MLSLNEIRRNAYEFAQEWRHEISEEAEAKSFWDAFFGVFGMNRRRVASFERAVHKLDNKEGYIDLLWKGTLLIEHKSRGKSLDTAYKQALGYFPGLKDAELPRYVLVCDFHTFRLHDLDSDQVETFNLAELPDKIHLFGFISGYSVRAYKDQDPVNIKAAEIMAGLHDAIVENGYSGHELEVFLMRTLFCLFAEDTGIFEKDQFRDFLETRTHEDGSDTGIRLGQLFDQLNCPVDQRQSNLDTTLRAFDYINGGLFAERLPMPEFDGGMRKILLDCTLFDWSLISPAIFGSLFQNVTDPKRRRSLGAHYTSEKNIRKVISGLFLDELRAEFDKLKHCSTKSEFQKLDQLHLRLAKIKFLDPSCGCGNFLVVAYRELRNLELDIFKAKLAYYPQTEIGSRLDVNCAYGIEIEEFPARVAETAMWLTDHLANRRLSEEFGNLYRRIPLQAQATIVHANALRIDWNDVLPADECTYVLGNPPFVGKHYQTKEQREDHRYTFDMLHNSGDLDFVACWHFKATKYISSSSNELIKVGFVSTNSITQGEQVAVLWPLLFEYGVTINFAHRTFKWTNDSPGAAAVHCVIIGFSLTNTSNKHIYYYDKNLTQPTLLSSTNITPYLTDGPTVIVKKRTSPLVDVPHMRCGNKPTDDGNLILTAIQAKELISDYPQIEPYVRQFIGSEELINHRNRWCLWLTHAPTDILNSIKPIRDRLDKIREFRKKSTAAPTRLKADTPYLFFYISQPNNKYIAIPETSSERRPRIPIEVFPPEVIVSNKVFVTEYFDPFLFGIIMSIHHTLWCATVAGRLKSDYSYAGSLVYNTFPWPQEVSDKQRLAIEQAAQDVLNARAAHPGATLAQLYDPLTMPQNLLKAHQHLDGLVDRLYQLPKQVTEAQRIARLFELYQKLTAPLLPVAKKTRAKRA